MNSEQCRWVALAAAAFLLVCASCSYNGLTGDTDGRREVRFTTGAGTTASARTAIENNKTVFKQGDEIGIFMLNSGNAALVSNKKYVVNAQGQFEPADNDNTLYYPPGDTLVGFAAYYPYQPGQTWAVIQKYVSFDQTGNEDIILNNDLLYYKTPSATLSNTTTGAVPLVFTHVLSKLKMTVTKGDGVNSLDGLTIKITDAPLLMHFDLRSGVIGNVFGTQTVMARQIQVPSGATPGIYEVLLTKFFNADTRAEFMVGGETYTWDLKAVFPSGLESGKLYDYAITLEKTGVKVAGSTITTWTGAGSGQTPGGDTIGIEINVSQTSPSSGLGWSYANNTFTISRSGLTYTVKGSTAANKVVVASGVTATVIMDNVSITNGAPPFRVSASANVTVTLKDGTTNTLIGASGNAGLEVNSGSLTINGNSGILNATGGQYGAGIGGGLNGSAGTIIINGGTVTATGDSGGAGIGGGAGSGPSLGGAGGTITINGGTVTATGSGGGYGWGAGIGGGSYGAGGTVTISGGTVIATAGITAIGAGQGSSNHGSLTLPGSYSRLS